MAKKNKNGIWIKYDRENGNWFDKDASYHKLYNDLKNTNVEWDISKSETKCMNKLCGELIATNGDVSGDIYVYYENVNNIKKPILYIHVHEFFDIDTKEKMNYIYFNGSSLECINIDGKYLPELIKKLYEIDKVKNRDFIKELGTRYKNYQRLSFLEKKSSYTEEEILFLYFMAYKKEDNLAISIVEKRSIAKDFDSLTNKNKANLYLNIKKSIISDNLTITSRKLLIELAKNGCLKPLSNTNEEIINDKDYIMNLLKHFYKSDKNALYCAELERHLPPIYRTDIDIIEQIYGEYTTIFDSTIARWIADSENKLITNSDFAYRLINSYCKSLINEGISYYRNESLYLYSDEILKDISNHILIGPESSYEKEYLKNISIKLLEDNIKNVLSYRRNIK